jgi:hypothetical protein
VARGDVQRRFTAVVPRVRGRPLPQHLVYI